MTATFIPLEREAEALHRYRDGHSAEALYAWLWPSGNPSISVAALRSILESLDAEDRPEPSDHLPDDLGDVLGDLRVARQRLMDALEAGPSLDGGPNPDVLVACQVSRALTDNVRATLSVSKHRIDLQRHRGILTGWWRSGQRS
jgi:hypothetical protein